MAGAFLWWFILANIDSIHEASSHRGPGVIHGGDGDRYPEWEREVSEAEYRRYKYGGSGFMIALSIIIWGVIAKQAAKPEEAAKMELENQERRRRFDEKYPPDVRGD